MMTDEVKNDVIDEALESLKHKIEIEKEDIQVENGEDVDRNFSIPFQEEKKVEEKKPFLKKFEAFTDSLSHAVDKEKVKETFEKIKESSIKTAESTKAKVEEIAQNPELNEKMAQAKEKITDVGEKMGKSITSGYEKVIETKSIKNVLDKVNEETEKLKKEVDDFMAKPEVNEKIEKAKDITIDITEKAAIKVKEWLRPSAEEVEKGEELFDEAVADIVAVDDEIVDDGAVSKEEEN